MKKLNVRENLWCYIAIVVGAIMIIMGLNIFSQFDVYYSTMAGLEFGADFYTEIHHAVARVANSIRELQEMFVLSFGLLFVFGGIIDICFFARKLTFNKETVEVPTDSVN